MTLEEFCERLPIGRTDHIAHFKDGPEDLKGFEDEVQSALHEAAKTVDPHGQSLGLGAIGRMYSKMDLESIRERAFEILKENGTF